MSGQRDIIATDAGQPRSLIVRGGAFLFVSGLTATDRGTTASETREILTSLKQMLESAGSSLDRVVKVPETDEYVTNICFAVDGTDRAYITSSGLGRLYATRWGTQAAILTF